MSDGGIGISTPAASDIDADVMSSELDVVDFSAFAFGFFADFGFVVSGVTGVVAIVSSAFLMMAFGVALLLIASAALQIAYSAITLPKRRAGCLT